MKKVFMAMAMASLMLAAVACGNSKKGEAAAEEAAVEVVACECDSTKCECDSTKCAECKEECKEECKGECQGCCKDGECKAE